MFLFVFVLEINFYCFSFHKTLLSIIFLNLFVVKKSFSFYSLIDWLWFEKNISNGDFTEGIRSAESFSNLSCDTCIS